MFAIGDDQWPGLSKLAEEAGEVVQVIGKLMGTHGKAYHWDGTDLRARLIEEIADVMAACEFVIRQNQLGDGVTVRFMQKLALFNKWHVDQTANQLADITSNHSHSFLRASEGLTSHHCSCGPDAVAHHRGCTYWTPPF